MNECYKIVEHQYVSGGMGPQFTIEVTHDPEEVEVPVYEDRSKSPRYWTMSKKPFLCEYYITLTRCKRCGVYCDPGVKK